MSSLKALKDHGHKIPFKPAKQHAANTMLTVEWAECSKPCMVYAARKISVSEKKNFHIVMGSALLTRGTLLAEFKLIDLNTKAEWLDKLFVHGNLSCIKPINALYYTLNYPECCAHCGSKRSLQQTVNAYPICKPCKEVKKKECCIWERWLTSYRLTVLVFNLFERTILFLQISFFLSYLGKASCATWRETWVGVCCYFVTFVFISYFALQICVNLTYDTSRISWKKNWWSLYIFFRSSRLLMFFNLSALKNFTIFPGKKTPTLLKRDSSADVFLWILQNF